MATRDDVYRELEQIVSAAYTAAKRKCYRDPADHDALGAMLALEYLYKEIIKKL